MWCIAYSSDDAKQIEILICEMNAGHMQWSRLCRFYTMCCRSTFQPHIPCYAVRCVCVCVNTYQLCQRDMFLFRIRQTNIAGHSNRGIVGNTNLCGYNSLCILLLSLTHSLSSLSFSLCLFIDTNIWSMSFFFFD